MGRFDLGRIDWEKQVNKWANGWQKKAKLKTRRVNVYKGIENFPETYDRLFLAISGDNCVEVKK